MIVCLFVCCTVWFGLLSKKMLMTLMTSTKEIGYISISKSYSCYTVRSGVASRPLN